MKHLELIQRGNAYVCCVSGKEFPLTERGARDSLFSAQIIRHDFEQRGLIRPGDLYDRVRALYQRARPSKTVILRRRKL